MSQNDPPEVRLRLMIVDDDEDLRLGLGMLLEAFGDELREAANAEEALEMLAEWTPQIMVVDLVMGAVSGMDLLRQVRQKWPQMKVLMVTGYGTPEIEGEAYRSGVDGYLEKPFDNAEMIAEVERLRIEVIDGGLGDRKGRITGTTKQKGEGK